MPNELNGNRSDSTANNFSDPDLISQRIEEVKRNVLGEEDEIESKEDQASAEPEIEIDIEEEQAEQTAHTVNDFIEAQKVLTALRMKDIEKRYKGKNKSLRRLKSWLAGEFDWALTQDGEVKRRLFSYGTRKFSSALLNKRGLGALASVAVTGVSLPALGTLLGGSIGWWIGEAKQSRAKKEDNLEESQKEIVKSQVEAILKLMPEIKAGKITNQTDMAHFINQAADIIGEQIKEDIETKHERVKVLREKWDKTKGKMFSWGAVVGLSTVMGPTIAAIMIHAKEQITKGITDYGMQNFDKAMTGTPYPQQWLDLSHHVIKKGGQWYFQVVRQDQLWAGVTTEIGKLHSITLNNIPAGVAEALEKEKYLQLIGEGLKTPLIEAGVALAGALIPGLFGNSKKIKERIAEIKPEEKITLEEKEETKVIPLMPRQPILPASEVEIKQLPAWQEGRFYLIAFLGEYGQPSIGLAQFNGIIYNNQNNQEEPCYDLQFFKTVEGGGKLVASDRLNLPVSQFENIARILINPNRLGRIGYYQRQEDRLTSLLPQPVQEQLKNQEGTAPILEEPNSGEETEAEEIEDQIDDIEGLTKHLEELEAEADVARRFNVQGLPGIEQEIKETRSDLEKLLAERKPAPRELSTEEMEEYDEARAFAQITLARVKNLQDLQPRKGQTPHERFLELTRELWTDLTVHGIYRKGKLITETDLDGKTCLGLFKLAGIKINDVHYVKPGEMEKGRTMLDTGPSSGIDVPEPPINGANPDSTTIINHYEYGSSAAGYTYYAMINLGLIKPTPELDNLIDFVSAVDNLDIPVSRNWYANYSSRTMVGLQRFVSFEKLLQFFKDGRDPTEVLTDQDLRDYGLKYTRKNKEKVDRENQQREVAEISIAAIKKLPVNTLDSNGGIIETTRYGKILVNTNNTIPGGATAAKALGFGGYVNWNQQSNSFTVSSFDHELTDTFSQGVKPHDRMWIKPQHDKTPLTFTLADVISQLSDGAVNIIAPTAQAAETSTSRTTTPETNKPIQERIATLRQELEQLRRDRVIAEQFAAPDLGEIKEQITKKENQLKDLLDRANAIAPTQTGTLQPAEAPAATAEKTEKKNKFRYNSLLQYVGTQENYPEYFLITNPDPDNLDAIYYRLTPQGWRKSDLGDAGINNLTGRRINLQLALDNNEFTMIKGKRALRTLEDENPELRRLISSDRAKMRRNVNPTQTATDEPAPAAAPIQESKEETPIETATTIPAATAPATSVETIQQPTAETIAPNLEEAIAPAEEITPAPEERSPQNERVELNLPNRIINNPFIILDNGDVEEITPEQIVDKTNYIDPVTGEIYHSGLTIRKIYVGNSPAKPRKNVQYLGKNGQGRAVYRQASNDEID